MNSDMGNADCGKVTDSFDRDHLWHPYTSTRLSIRKMQGERCTI